MKVVAVFKYLSLVGGALLLVSALMSYQSSKQFVEEALSTTGVVVDLLENRGEEGMTYIPVVAFVDKDDRPVSFSSSIASSPPAYAIGEKVGVLYLPGQPEDARIDDLAGRWGLSIALLVFGLPLFSVGLIMVLLARRKKSRNHYLQRHGHVVRAEFEAVILNHSVSINGRSPFVIVCNWLNPATSQLHVLESENIWFDPTPYIKDNNLRVLMDKRDTRKYQVDLSFLPKLAN